MIVTDTQRLLKDTPDNKKKDNKNRFLTRERSDTPGSQKRGE
jgi:hypothetical protein